MDEAFTKVAFEQTQKAITIPIATNRLGNNVLILAARTFIETLCELLQALVKPASEATSA